MVNRNLNKIAKDFGNNEIREKADEKINWDDKEIVEVKRVVPDGETKFTVKYHHRHDLRSWIRENFPFVENLPLRNEELLYLRRRASEIIEACRTVEKKDKCYGSAYVDYYSSCWKKLEEAYEAGDYQEFASGLDYLLTSIDWE